MNKAIIGGTGCQSFIPEDSTELVVSTPYGEVTLFQSGDIFYLLRHRKGHTVPPHLINYRAHIDALRQVGVECIIAIYAVGSVTEALPPGEAGILGQFIDMTSGREHTFYSEPGKPFAHTAMDAPYSESLNKALLEAGREKGITLVSPLTYVCTNGPRLETPAEIAMYRILSGDVVGMTGATETALACEAGIPIAGIAYSINWAAGVGTGQISFIDEGETGKIVERLTRLAQTVLDSI